MGAASKEGAETFVSHRQVMENLEHLNQDRNWHREQDNRLERVYHLEQQH